MASPAMIEQRDMINDIVRSRPARCRVVTLLKSNTVAVDAVAIVQTQNRLLEQLKYIESTFPKTNETLAK